MHRVSRARLLRPILISSSPLPTATTTLPHRFFSSTPTSSMPNKQPMLTLADLNPAVANVEYAVRGELAIKAEDYRVRLQEKPEGHGLPFQRVISSNIGNPQQKGLDQKPVTWTRQIAALTEFPELAELAPGAFPKDVVARAKELSDEIGSIGAYSHSQGVPFIREHVAQFISERDGYPSDPSHIFLTAGASAGVSLLINLLIDPSKKSGILIPIPQYPLYTAALAQFDGIPVPYHLDESAGWSTSISDVEAALEKAGKEGTKTKAMVVINPGNPTGAILDEKTMESIVKTCEKHSLVLMADEVYQDNLHDRENHPFVSFKKVVSKLQSPIPLVSFHSISKGVSGECGRRGGYFELVNFPEDVRGQIYKMVSVGLCPPLSGQIGVDSMVRPPKQGGESYELWKSETSATHAALAQRTQLMAARLNALPGVSCVQSPGALYLFPKITLPPRALEEAKKRGKEPDVMYALDMLDKTGVCVVAGSGFGQKEGEAHYRVTCLCPGVEEYVGLLEGFHREFYEKYS